MALSRTARYWIGICIAGAISSAVMSLGVSEYLASRTGSFASFAGSNAVMLDGRPITLFLTTYTAGAIIREDARPVEFDPQSVGVPVVPRPWWVDCDGVTTARGWPEYTLASCKNGSRVLWRGLLIGTATFFVPGVIYAAVMRACYRRMKLGFLLSIHDTLREQRRRRWAIAARYCATCGYDLASLPSECVCPECGKRRGV